MRYLKPLTLRSWAWLHFKVALGLVWPTVMLFNAPTGVVSTLERNIVTVWCIVTFFGGLISILGLIMSVQESANAKLLGVSVELVGLILFAVGPLLYFMTQFVLSLGENGWAQRGALTVFAYAMLSVLVYRLAIVIPLFRKEATDETKEL